MGKYDINKNSLLNKHGSHEKLIKRVKPNSVVLEFGPAGGSMTEYMRDTLNCEVYIVEINKIDFEKALVFAKDGICGDASDLGWLDKFSGLRFDYILFADVLEHLHNPTEVLTNAMLLLKDDGRVLISVPNIAHNSVIINLVKNKFEYKSIGLLDSTHLRFFTYYSLLEMLDTVGLATICEDATYMQPVQTEFCNDYDNVSGSADILSNKQFGTVYQFIVEAVKKDYYHKNKDCIVVEKNITSGNSSAPALATIFYDSGESFNETEKTYFAYENDQISWEINLPSGVKSLRFDPLEGYCCVVKQLEIVSGAGQLICTNLNGFAMGNHHIFLTKDPQFLIKIPPGAEWVKIECKIIPCNTSDLIGFLCGAKQFIDDTNRREADHKAIANKQEVEYETLVSRYGADVKQWETEYKELEKLLENKQRLLEKNVSELKNEILSGINAQIELKNLMQDAQHIATEKIAGLYSEIEELNRRLINAKNDYQNIINSRTWRITKPYRWINLRARNAAYRIVPLRLFVKFLKSWRRHGLRTATSSARGYLQGRKNTGYMYPDTHSPLPTLFYDSVYQDNVDYTHYLTKIKALAFYLPQFHQIPENDEWWGEGFTEWTNTEKSIPRFEGHYQPRIPHRDIGYYTLDTIETIEKQAKLAKQHGIYGFCFYYYWFSGKRLLEKPVDLLLKNPQVDINFCLCWANENWTRRWDGQDKAILIEQKHHDDDPIRFMDDIKPYIDDPRYIRHDGKPVIVVYNPSTIRNIKLTFEKWRARARENGIGEILIWVCNVFRHTAESLNITSIVDASIQFPPHTVCYGEARIDDTLHYNYQTSVNIAVKELEKSAKIEEGLPNYKSVMLGWDNAARRGDGFACFKMFSLESFYKWCRAATDFTNRAFDEESRYMFVNAWNEWAEGTYLEPDEKYGYASINTFSKGIFNLPFESNSKKIFFVGHDAYKHGAQMLSLSIIKYLCTALKYDVYVILKTGLGDLLDDYKRYATKLYCINHMPHQELKAWIKQAGALNAICNTVITGDVLKTLTDCGVSCISLIHEMEKVIKHYSCEDSLRNINNYAKKVILPSYYVKDSVAKIDAVPEAKAVICPQALYHNVSTSKSKAECRREICNKYGLPDDVKIVLNVGYADHRKGADLFARCAASVCDESNKYVFIWVGNLDPAFPVSDMAASGPAKGRLIFAGMKTDMSVYYNAADLFMLTSREDPFPSVVLEAMSCALPVVAFKGGGGYVDVIIPDRTGVLVPMEDVEALSAQVVRLLGDDALRTGMGKLAYEKIKDRAHFGEYVHTLLSLLGEKYKTVSVVIPNFNYARYLPARIESVLNQEYPVSEIIILDDKSADNSAEIIESYVKRYPLLIKAIYNDENSGNVFTQWEKGLSHATGEYVWIAEADDLSAPGFLGALITKMAEDDEIIMGYTQSKMIDSDGVIWEEDYLSYTNDIDPQKYKNNYVSNGLDEIRERLAVKNTIPNVSAVVFRNRDDFPALLQNAKQYKVAGDWRFYIDLLRLGGKIFFYAKSLNFHRRHTKGVTTSLNADKHYDEICDCQQYVADICFDGTVGKDANRYRDWVKAYLHKTAEEGRKEAPPSVPVKDEKPPDKGAVPFTPDMAIGADTWDKYYDVAEQLAEEQFNKYLLPILVKHEGVNLSDVLDFACGRGRIAGCFSAYSRRVTGCDVYAEAIEYCRKRSANAMDCLNTFVVNNTDKGGGLYKLPFEENAFTFVYSWDAMVHFSYEWVDFYVKEFYRVAQPGAYIVIHHSNLAGLNKEEHGEWFENDHSRAYVSREDMMTISKKHGFAIIAQQLVDWGGVPNLDCISVLLKPRS